LTVTEPGRRLARVYGVHDLLAAEAVRSGILDDCPPGALAAVLSSLVYEARGGGHREPIRLPDRATERAMEEMRRLWREIRLTERDHRLEQQPPLDIGFTRAAHAWAEGEDLGEILEETDLAAGDFVRWIRQIIDVAGQIADASRGRPLAGRARDLARSMRRGVVDFTDE
jgi:ATP-dependent RNA helicase HelY